MASLLDESFQVHRLDDLDCGLLNLEQGDTSGLANEVLVVQDSITPGDAKEVEDELEGATGVQHQLLVVHRQTLVLAHLHTLCLHHLNGLVPLGGAVVVAAEVKASNGDLAGDHGVHQGPAISHHQQGLRVGEQA